MIHKKIIGSVVFFLMIAGISLTGYYFADAKNANSQNVHKSENTEGYGYGTVGHPINVPRGTVTAMSSNSFTVDTGTEIITFTVDSSTSFIKTTFSDLAIGNVVTIHGTSFGSDNLAKLVILQKNKTNNGHNSESDYKNANKSESDKTLKTSAGKSNSDSDSENETEND